MADVLDYATLPNGALFTAKDDFKFGIGTVVHSIDFNIEGAPSSGETQFPSDLPHRAIASTLFRCPLLLSITTHDTRVLKGEPQARNRKTIGAGEMLDMLPVLSTEAEIEKHCSVRDSGSYLLHKGCSSEISLGAIQEGNESFDLGTFKIRYYLLGKRLNRTDENKKRRENPIDKYIRKGKPLIFVNGIQVQGELTGKVMRDTFSQLGQYMIVEIDCTGLTPTGKQQLFLPNRSDIAATTAKSDILETVKAVLRGDNELRRLEAEALRRIAAGQSTELDESGKSTLASLLESPEGQAIASLFGLHMTEEKVDPAKNKAAKASAKTREQKEQVPPPIVVLLPTTDNPSIFEFIQTSPLKLTPGRKASIGIRTNAHPNMVSDATFNFDVESPLRTMGRTDLTPASNVFNILIDVPENSKIGSRGIIIAGLRVRKETLTITREFEIVAPKTKQPKEPEVGHVSRMPHVEFTGISPDAAETKATWDTNVPEDVFKTLKEARERFTFRVLKSEDEQEKTHLQVIFSTVYPPYADRLKAIRKERSVIKGAKESAFIKGYTLALTAAALAETVVIKKVDDPELEFQIRQAAATFGIMYADQCARSAKEAFEAEVTAQED